MPSASTPLPARAAPILLWAITHPTLVKAEVPLLREAGFEVVVQEPTDHIRGVDLIEYPDVLRFPDAAGDARIAAARDLGPRLRLGPRAGVVTANEATIVNWAFDAIMIDDHRLAERRIPQWFRGTVLFRDFGNIPGRQRPDRRPRHRRGSNVVGVPILSGLASTRFERSLCHIQTLGTVVPPPPVAANPDGAGHEVVSIFVAGLDTQAWFLPWLRSFKDSIPPAVEIRVFGARESVASACRDLGIRPVVRLPSTEYWALFAASSLWVYPHENPLHSHYIPLEAISIGIPCILAASTAVAAESRSSLTGDLGGYGIVSDKSELGALAANLLQSQSKRQEVAKRQRVLLRPFSKDTVLAQARSLAHFVTDVNASRPRPSRPRIASEDVGPPSAAHLKSALADSIPNPVTVSASALAVTWPMWHLNLPRSRAVRDPRTSSLRLTHWLVRPGPDVNVSIGAVAHVAGRRTAFWVALEMSTAFTAPVMLEVVDPEGQRDVVPWALERRRGGSMTVTGYVDVDPDQVVAIRVVSALAPKDLRLGKIKISRVTKDTLSSPPGSATGASAPTEDCGIPLWTAGWSARSKGRWLSHLTRGRLAIVRFSLSLLRGVDSTDSWYVQSTRSPSGSEDNSRTAVIVATRQQSEWRFRLLVLRIGPLLIRRPLSVCRDSPLWAVGTRKGIMGVVAECTTMTP